MASIINASTSSGIVQTADTSGILQLQTAGTTAVTVDASQNVGIGLTSPVQQLQTTKQTLFDSGGNGVANNVGVGVGSSNTGLFWLTGNSLGVSTNGSERMRIDSSGNLQVGASGLPGRINGKIATATSTTRIANTLMQLASNASGADVSIWLTDSTSYNYFFGGYNGTAYVTTSNSGGVKLAGGATSWAADSDERLKNIKAPITNAVENLSTLRAVYGNYKTDETDVSRLFLIAQDVQKVYPEAVDVYQDEDKTLGLRYQELMPVLVAAIQEQQTIINDLKARITALEGAK